MVPAQRSERTAGSRRRCPTTTILAARLSGRETRIAERKEFRRFSVGSMQPATATSSAAACRSVASTIGRCWRLGKDACTPEYRYLLSRWGSLLPYRQAASLLDDLLPVSSSGLAQTEIRRQTLKVGEPPRFASVRAGRECALRQGIDTDGRHPGMLRDERGHRRTRARRRGQQRRSGVAVATL